MTTHPSQAMTAPEPITEAADLSSLAVAGEAADVVPAEGQLRILRGPDVDAAAAAAGNPDVIGDAVADADPLPLEAQFWLAELVPTEDDVYLDVVSVAEEHSRAAPPPLSEPGDVIDLLSGSEALEAIDALAPFTLPDGLSDRDVLTFASPVTLRADGLGHHHDDLILLDFTPFAKPDNPGKGNGGGGAGGDGGDGGTLSSYLSGDPNVADSTEYNIQITFKGSWTVELQDAFLWAADWISDVIIGDVQDVFFRGKVIDDISITAELKEIDGSGGILGQAGPTAIRTSGYLPAAGKMEFDIADANVYYEFGLWDDIVLHEMLHTIGFGTIWDYLGLVDGSGTSTPTFTGEQAMIAYVDLLNDDDIVEPTAVPLESGWGPGTDESHWDEDTFGNEIMTGFIDDPNYTSDMTVASLADLGYVITTDPWSDPLSTATV